MLDPALAGFFHARESPSPGGAGPWRKRERPWPATTGSGFDSRRFHQTGSTGHTRKVAPDGRQPVPKTGPCHGHEGSTPSPSAKRTGELNRERTWCSTAAREPTKLEVRVRISSSAPRSPTSRVARSSKRSRCVALTHEIEVRVLAGQPNRGSGVGGPRAGLKSRRSWFDSSGSHQCSGEELGWSQRRFHTPDTWVRLPPPVPHDRRQCVAQKLKGERPVVNRRVVSSILTWAANHGPVTRAAKGADS